MVESCSIYLLSQCCVLNVIRHRLHHTRPSERIGVLGCSSKRQQWSTRNKERKSTNCVCRITLHAEGR